MGRSLAPTKLFRCSALFLGLILVWGCDPDDAGSPVLQAQLPLHLEDHLAAATIVGSEAPEGIPEVRWRFDEAQPNWRPAKAVGAQLESVKPVRTDDALRLLLTAVNRAADLRLVGTIYVDVPDWTLKDWAYVEIRARTRDRMGAIGLGFNYSEEDPLLGILPIQSRGEWAPLVTDGTVQTYRLPLKAPRVGRWEGSWTHLAIWFNSRQEEEAATLDILSVRVIPREAEFAGSRAGVRTEQRDNAYRRVLYTHAPGRIDYRVKVPEAGRLDLGLGVLLDNAPVTFAITARRNGGEPEILLEETYADPDFWAQRSVDLSHLARQTVTLSLEADAERVGTVALWAAPTLSDARTTDKPNVIFYVIDGAGADLMSVYGYERRTTPNLERLATEGAVFERAYSNSSWTKVSTPSFMTSLQTSVLGGYRTDSDPLPEEAVTITQHLHIAGYQTAVFTANPYAGTMSTLERGADALRENWTGLSWFGRDNNSLSSVFLHGSFWGWREAYPGEPYWVHFQTTDVHWPWRPAAPFAGLFIRPELRERYYGWERQLRELGGPWLAADPDLAAFAETGISPVAYFDARRDLYDETMVHQDDQLGRLVERLKAAGEWEHTLLVIAADHAQWSALLRDPSSPHWGPILRSSVSHVPLIIVWPGRIEGGQRFSQPVSMIDVLPTILDLAGLPMPDVVQGQSLAPLLLGEEGWEPRPVILDQFYADKNTGELSGFIEVIDGRWGASLLIGHPLVRSLRISAEGRPAPLLVCDLWNDPDCRYSLHEERPDLVEKYTEFLETQFEAHQVLAQLFTPGGEVELTPAQLETLRSLGYIQ